ncbi:AraC family transcriptional regulator [Dyadobacter chenwenxiniae]|uniref:AraC family transcriptional regulator n=1 Tax=Dyadobacter chenwenxiniae TaxID=2906456 RepID=A0A9X1PSL7_9BACT|nr:helix-turn-helix domain-containing protein [Dyadobacter chenwenxiniae]MCF0065324.1 AraC family transcriptional regulator [Dyadobacter chenwenxiniae]UON84408.1 AraC family transcriptional regulator [Dyadobacter chenwenxiniae]
MEIPIKNKLAKKELFKIKRMKEVIKTTDPHGHKDYLEIIYLEQGAGFHQIDFNRFTVKPHSLYLVMPGQIHSWELTEIPKGFVAMIQKDFLLDQPLYNTLFQTFPLSLPSGFDLEAAKETFSDIFRNIELEYTRGLSNHEAVIQTYLLLLFNLLKREIRDHQAVPYPALLKDFFDLLQADFQAHHETAFYADQLHITPKTLNTACKKFLGKTAGAVVNEKLTAEAKKLLLYSHRNLTELAFELGFSDASHFNKFFKRQTGVLPGIYRKGIS